METLLNRPLILLALLASLAMALLHGLGGAGDDALAREPGATAAGGEAVRGGPAQSLALAPPAPGAAQASANVAHGMPVAAARRASLGERFEHADDLYVFLQTLLPAAAAGDADAAWMASRVYDYCAAHAADPAAYARDTDALVRMGLGASGAIARARARVAHRCRQFGPGDGLGRELVVLQRVEAAEAGSLAAEASLLAMGEPLDDDEGYRRELADRVRESADAEAFSALAPAMGLAASGDPAFVGQVAGTQAAELAWQLGACGLGLDCSPQGALMTSMCANGGVCSRDARQDFPAFVMDAALPPGEEEAIDELVDSLLREGVPR